MQDTNSLNDQSCFLTRCYWEDTHPPSLAPDQALSMSFTKLRINSLLNTSLSLSPLPALLSWHPSLVSNSCEKPLERPEIPPGYYLAARGACHHLQDVQRTHSTSSLPYRLTAIQSAGRETSCTSTDPSPLPQTPSDHSLIPPRPLLPWNSEEELVENSDGVSAGLHLPRSARAVPPLLSLWRRDVCVRIRPIASHFQRLSTNQKAAKTGSWEFDQHTIRHSISIQCKNQTNIFAKNIRHKH